VRPIVLLATLLTAIAAGITIAAGGVDEKAEKKAKFVKGPTPPHTTRPAPATPVTATVRMSALAFAPLTVHVRRGTAVRFVNRDDVVHNITSDITNGDVALFHSPRIAIGKSYEIAFPKVGTYTYVCTVHPTVMHGRIVVTKT
jgi:plastocyanin